MRSFLLGLALLGSLAAGAARADEFDGQQSSASAIAALDRSAVDAQQADPTAANSVRSHGRP